MYRYWKKAISALQESPFTFNVSIRSATTTVIDNYEEADSRRPKPYSQIPGPKGLPLVGNLWSYLKNDRYYLLKSHLLQMKYTKQYGPIYKENIGIMKTVVVTDPKDALRVFQAEGKYPTRGPIMPFIEYRRQYKRSRGIVVGEGEKWKKSRAIIDKKMLKVKDVSAYAPRMNSVITDFIDHIRQNRDQRDELIKLKDKLYKWSFETINTIIYNKRLGAISNPSAAIAERYFNSAVKVFEGSHKLMMYPPYFKYIKTKYWKEYCGHWDTLFQIGGQFVQEESQRLKNQMNANIVAQSQLKSENLEFLTYVLMKGELSVDDVTANAVELMTASIDTSASTVLWTLYILGKYPDIQEKLYQEISSVLNKSEYPNAELIQRMPYLRGLIKEVQRVYPVALNIIRKIPNDVVLSGYQISANTTVIVGLYAMSFDPSLYDEPDKFKPERRDRSSTGQKIKPFSFLPFGFGPRMCIGRRVAELEIKLLIIRLISEFNIECHNTEDVGMACRFILIPDSDIHISFKDRS